jgi:hypothetical protein
VSEPTYGLAEYNQVGPLSAHRPIAQNAVFTLVPGKLDNKKAALGGSLDWGCQALNVVVKLFVLQGVHQFFTFHLRLLHIFCWYYVTSMAFKHYILVTEKNPPRAGGVLSGADRLSLTRKGEKLASHHAVLFYECCRSQ